MKNIVIIGGGTGTFTLLAGLRKYPTNNTTIVSSSDDGGSTGKLRKELGVMPPGDIRQCLIGLSYTDDILKQLFSYRFDRGSLSGHNVGNIIIAALEKISGNIDTAIEESAKILNVRGQVLPVTKFPSLLTATLSNGRIIKGEHNLDEEHKSGNVRIKSLKVTPSAPVNPKVLAAIKKADAIILGPGDLYTSTLPNLVVKGVASAVAKSRAKKILITNLMSKYGQTQGFSASDFVVEINKYLGSKEKSVLDAVIVNTQKPDAKIIAKYRKERSEYTKSDVDKIESMGVKVIARPLLSKKIHNKPKGDVLQRSSLRHDTDKISKIIWELIS